MTLPTWAVVEQMGHVTYGAYVSEVELAGAKLLRLDVPEVERVEYYPARERRRYHAWHTLIGASSVYRLTPCSEERARKAAATGTHNEDAGWEVIPEVPQIAEAEVVCCGDCLTEIHPLNGCECGQHDGPRSGGGDMDTGRHEWNEGDDPEDDGGDQAAIRTYSEPTLPPELAERVRAAGLVWHRDETDRLNPGWRRPGVRRIADNHGVWFDTQTTSRWIADVWDDAPAFDTAAEAVEAWLTARDSRAAPVPLAAVPASPARESE